jgi:hypothetical protein
MKAKRMIGLLLVFLPMVMGAVIVPPSFTADSQGTAESKTVELSNGELIEIAPDEVVYEYRLSDLPSLLSGAGDSLLANDYGVRVDSFTDARMDYDSGTSSLTTADLSVPLGEGWESYAVYTDVTSITENRTWIENSGLDDSSQWTFTTDDIPSIYGPSYTNALTSQWQANGHGTGNGAAYFYMDGYYYNAGGGLYGDWYDVGDKAYIEQNITINRGEITSLGISLDYWADVAWSGYMTGFFEVFVSVGDPDNGGSYLWNIPFDAIPTDNTWYSTGYVSVDPSLMSLPNVTIWAGLRTTAFEWWRPDINPQARVDNILIYVTAKATPDDVNLQMNGEDVDSVMVGPDPVFGLGTAWYIPPVPWSNGAAYANFSWTPTPNPPDPDFDINVNLDVDVWVFARRLQTPTIGNTELLTLGDNYEVANASAVSWETNFYVSIPGGYGDQYFYNVSIPANRDITFLSEPFHRFTNLTSGWTFGGPGDGLVNVSVYSMGLSDPNGLWMIRGTSPNMISTVEVWNDGASSWTPTRTFRADEDTRFRATLSSTYQGDTATFVVYDSQGIVWDTLQAVVDSSGYATTGYVNLDAISAAVGDWEVQVSVTDETSGGAVHNVGYFRRAFTIEHGTQVSVKYPLDAVGTWTVNVTYGDVIFIQLRVNDTDNGDLLPGGTMQYSGGFGSGTANDMGTGEYSLTLDTSTLGSNGQYQVNFFWTKPFYDSLGPSFTINVIYETNLYSSDAPGIDIPSGYDAELHLYFEDMNSQPVTGASIICNWTQSYDVTPESPGHYTLSLDTIGAALDLYNLLITASKDYYQKKSIVLSVDVRELHTSAIPSTSFLSLPVGYTTSFTITYRDTDFKAPISGAESAITCNWSDYSVVETTTPGVYQVNINSADDDTLGEHDILFAVEQFGAQNHTFVVTVELRTHLTSLYLNNAVDPAPYTGNITVSLVYYDVDASTGIVNGTTPGGYVQLIITSPTLPSPSFTIVSISPEGLYTIVLPADQWADVGTVGLTLAMNWIGVNPKYSNLYVSTSAVITAAPTDVFIGDSPVVTPYDEDISFSIIFYDVGADTGVVNSTGPYSGNVHIYVQILTSGESITQADMTIIEIDALTNPGEYQFSFDTGLLSGLGELQMRVWFNWTAAQLPYYQNRDILITITTISRLTTVDWTPIPLTPYDELVNLSIIFRDSLSGDPILNDAALSIGIPGYGFTVYYDGDLTGIFYIEIDTSVFAPGSHSITMNVEWAGQPFYQNRTGVVIPISVRERYTSLTHGTYAPTQYGNILHLNFTYRDLDDYTTSGMDGGTLTLDTGLLGYYTVDDLGNGIYTVHLDTSVFGALGLFTVNASIEYGGLRYCADATNSFFLSVTARRTQLTSDLPDLAPFLTQANITVYYIDDNTDAGISGAMVTVDCPEADDILVLGLNYWVDDNSDGSYLIRIQTTALGNFGSYSISVTVQWTSGAPFYQTRIRDVDIEVSRRPTSLTVSKSPLNTPYGADVTFEITISDELGGSGISLTKANLVLSHGIGTVIADGQYTLTGSNGVYVITVNSLVLTSVLVNGHGIFILFEWGDVSPYYDNATTSTEVNIEGRFTQVTVLQTPPGYYYFNMSALLRFTDYLTGGSIAGASVTIDSPETGGFTYWVIDNLDGTYSVIIDTNSLPGLGIYNFTADFEWTGAPYYRNVTGVAFSLVVNPVSTTLTFVLPEGVTYYLGDIVYANITYTSIEFGTGIDGATVTTNWEDLYGTEFTITPFGGGTGIYQMAINTSTLAAQGYRFMINATKAFHQSQSVEVDILLAAVPVQIQLAYWPTSPVYGDTVYFQATVTDARNSQPVIGAAVNLTLSDTWVLMLEVADGVYNCSIETSGLSAGEYAVSVTSILTNYETRRRDFQIRIDKIPAKISASLVPQSAVDGQSVEIRVDYLIYADSTAIQGPDVHVTYSWVGGTGNITWSVADGKYVGTIIVSNASVGAHQILIQASSDNFKSVSTQVTIEITEIATSLAPVTSPLVVVNYRDIAVITVYLNNTDLGLPVTSADLTFGVGGIVGDLVEDATPGYYTANIDTELLSVQDWTVTISSSKDGYAPSSIQYTLTVERIATDAVILTEATLSGYYGTNVTFFFLFNDTHAAEGIPGALTNYTLEGFRGSLFGFGNGTYSLTLNTSLVTAGSIPHDISVTFRKDNYEFSSALVKLLVRPIPTVVLGEATGEFPVYDDYTMTFGFWDTLNGEWVFDGIATAVWEFGTVPLTNLGNGTYRFGPSEANLTSALQERDTPYNIRISISRGNYSRAELQISLTIRKIATSIVHTVPGPIIYVGDVFFVNATLMDTDHGLPISDAEIVVSSTSASGLELTRVSELDVNHGNGSYSLAFRAPSLAFYNLRIEFRKTYYQVAVIQLDVYPSLSPEQELLVAGFQYGTLAILLIAALAALYIRVLSVPRLLRILRGMVSALGKGRIPKPANVPLRRQMLLAVMNEELQAVGIKKTLDDVALSTVDITVMDVEDLLVELATVVGLTDADVDTLRADLDKMRPSERAGFINEVLKQERARRAKELAEVEEEVPAEEAEAVGLSDEELEQLRKKLLSMGIEESEAELMIEQAKHLTKAEIDALLDQIGGMDE